jgi:thiol-disulfide isomerase/thioredoxin
MGKAERNRARTARERIAAQQAAAARADQRRRILIVSGSVGLVLVIVVALLIFKDLVKPGKQGGSANIPAAVAHQITHVPVSTLASVGTGSLSASNLPIKPISGKALTSAGKPEMLYIGAEYCPFCAATRWSMAVALSRFGTFGPMRGIYSSSVDVYPNTPTLTFYKQRYSSPYLTFTPVENLDVHKKLLQVVTKPQNNLWVTYGTAQGSHGYPFIDFGNKVAIYGPLYIPQVLHGLTWAQVAGKLKNPSDPVAQAVDGEANYITASICKMTGNKPGSVCTAAPITALEGKL